MDLIDAIRTADIGVTGQSSRICELDRSGLAGKTMIDTGGTGDYPPRTTSPTMRIVFSLDRYSEGTGYAENVWPKMMAARGHEVYIVTSTMQIYGDAPFYRQVYEKFLGPPLLPRGRKVVDGVHVIRLPIQFWRSRFRIARARVRQILQLNPDIVQTDDPRSLQTLMLSWCAPFGRFKSFVSEHTNASVYPAYHSFSQWPWRRRIYLRLTETLIGRLACGRMSACYATTPDAGEIAMRFHGVRENIVKLLPLGTDTQLFHPARDTTAQQRREAMRARWGVAPDDIVCIYTGRFTEGKNPYCLAQAVAELRKEGRPFRAFFLGEGEQADRIKAADGSRIEAFVKYRDLPDYYRAADVGVWPAQDSTSMLDAAACGLPIVVSDRLMAVERIEGNGLSYPEGDSSELARQLRRLLDTETRTRMGVCSAEKMRTKMSAERVVDVLLRDYAAAITPRSSSA